MLRVSHIFRFCSLRWPIETQNPFLLVVVSGKFSTRPWLCSCIEDQARHGRTQKYTGGHAFPSSFQPQGTVAVARPHSTARSLVKPKDTLLLVLCLGFTQEFYCDVSSTCQGQRTPVFESRVLVFTVTRLRNGHAINRFFYFVALSLSCVNVPILLARRHVMKAHSSLNVQWPAGPASVWGKRRISTRPQRDLQDPPCQLEEKTVYPRVDRAERCAPSSATLSARVPSARLHQLCSCTVLSISCRVPSHQTVVTHIRVVGSVRAYLIGSVILLTPLTLLDFKNYIQNPDRGIMSLCKCWPHCPGLLEPCHFVILFAGPITSIAIMMELHQSKKEGHQFQYLGSQCQVVEVQHGIPKLWCLRVWNQDACSAHDTCAERSQRDVCHKDPSSGEVFVPGCICL